MRPKLRRLAKPYREYVHILLLQRSRIKGTQHSFRSYLAVLLHLTCFQAKSKDFRDFLAFGIAYR